MLQIDPDRELVQQIIDLTTRHKLTALELSCFLAEKASVSRTQREIVALLDELVAGGALQAIGDAPDSLYRPTALSPAQELAWGAIDREDSARWIDENTTLNGFYRGRLHYLNVAKTWQLHDQDCYNRVSIPGDGPSEFVVDGETCVHFSSNDYLGLARHPAVVDAARAALDAYGLGSSGSRLACGTQPPHRELEQTIARFKGTEDAIVLNTGYTMNLVLTSLVDQSCVIFSDELNHASIIDGTHLARVRVVRFAHNDMADLDAKLSQTPRATRKYIVIEGVYSMDGDIARIDELLPVARRHGALVAVDEAHSAGVLGAHGRGVFEHFGIDPGHLVLKAGTLGKAFGACGGYIAGPRLVTDMLKYTARPFMFSTSLPAAVVAGAKAGFEVLERHPELARRVQSNARYVRGRLQDMGFDTHLSETQVIPIIIPDDHKLGQLHQDLEDAGIWVMAVRYPAVPRSQGRLRLSLSAAHTQDQMDRLLEVLAARGKALGLI